MTVTGGNSWHTTTCFHAKSDFFKAKFKSEIFFIIYTVNPCFYTDHEMQTFSSGSCFEYFLVSNYNRQRGCDLCMKMSAISINVITKTDCYEHLLKLPLQSASLLYFLTGSEEGGNPDFVFVTWCHGSASVFSVSPQLLTPCFSTLRAHVISE